jgi:hypothetical protein
MLVDAFGQFIETIFPQAVVCTPSGREAFRSLVAYLVQDGRAMRRFTLAACADCSGRVLKLQLLDVVSMRCFNFGAHQ